MASRTQTQTSTVVATVLAMGNGSPLRKERKRSLIAGGYRQCAVVLSARSQWPIQALVCGSLAGHCWVGLCSYSGPIGPLPQPGCSTKDICETQHEILFRKTYTSVLHCFVCSFVVLYIETLERLSLHLRPISAAQAHPAGTCK
jgi:hypothetical protein